jgi:hypothetical protein
MWHVLRGELCLKRVHVDLIAVVILILLVGLSIVTRTLLILEGTLVLLLEDLQVVVVQQSLDQLVGYFLRLPD